VVAADASTDEVTEPMPRLKPGSDVMNF